MSCARAAKTSWLLEVGEPAMASPARSPFTSATKVGTPAADLISGMDAAFAAVADMRAAAAHSAATGSPDAAEKVGRTLAEEMLDDGAATLVEEQAS